MRLIELAITSAITASIGGISYAALNPRELEGTAQRVADQATCRTVDTAIVGYLMNNGTQPTSIAQIEDYVRGDISRYRIVNGIADGPGCAKIRR
ncbi:hypothetical protein [Actinoplanes couchii]|uniref:hypothetical protein n=1 Tax=Actinoplanes couchii TaxID=403638 RepID=UPI0019416A34|nr:hypothetical protein [Actinoplanes couchii]MDR6321236.1 hypothetical protein [Actinoplanes couchii]